MRCAHSWRLPGWLVTAVCLLAFSLPSSQAAAQSPAEGHATEWAITTGGAAGIPGGVHGGDFWATQLRWGKVLTAPHGPGPLRGTLEYAFELVPAMIINQNGAIYGGGFNPFFWQYNFASSSGRRFVPYIQAGAGMLFTSRDFPATSSFNFTPQGGFGAYLFQKPQRAVSFGVRYHHISDAGIAKPNPGHNSLYFYAGLSWWK
jgi:hypothetical protein